MPDYAGPLLQRVVLSRTLWLVVVWPIAGFAWQALVVRRRIARARGPEASKRALGSARNAGVGCSLLAMAATLAHGWVLADAPHGEQALFEPIARGARFGQLDAAVDLLFDPTAATFSALACLVALGVATFMARRPSAAAGWRPWAWLQLSLAGALVTFAADGFVAMAIGWALSGIAAAWLAGWNGEPSGTVAATRSAVAITAMLLGAALLFWGLGGSWDGDDYAPDAQPRFAAVPLGGSSGIARDNTDAPEQAASGALTFTSVPGALVFVDDARTPLAQSPFVDVPVRVGAHALRIHSGDGTNDDILGRVTFQDGVEVALVPMGPTFSFRAMADQLALRDREDNAPVRSALERRVGPGSAAVVAASLVALLLAAALMSGAMPSSGASPALVALAQGGTMAALGPYLVTRVAFLFPLAPSTWMALEAMGAAILLMASWQAPTASGLRRWAVFVGAAPAPLAYLALGAAGATVATCVFVASGAATAVLYLATAGDLTVLPDRAPEPQPSIEDRLFVLAPERLGALLIRMDRWVVSAIAGTLGALTHLVAWIMLTVDEQVVAAPANFVAARIVSVERGVEPMFGVTLVRAAWAVLGAIAFAALAHALWRGR
jgi:hypothetical protein